MDSINCRKKGNYGGGKTELVWELTRENHEKTTPENKSTTEYM